MIFFFFFHPVSKGVFSKRKEFAPLGEYPGCLIKNRFLISPEKHMLWVLIRIALQRFLEVLTLFSQKNQILSLAFIWKNVSHLSYTRN